MQLKFSRQNFEKNILISNSIKFRPVAAELLHSDRQTDRHDVTNSRFSQFFENRPKPDVSSASQELPLLLQNCTVSPPLFVRKLPVTSLLSQLNLIPILTIWGPGVA